VGSRNFQSQSQRQSHWQSLSLARSLGHVLAGAALSMALALSPQGAMARQQPELAGAVGTITAPQLPNEARQTLDLIQAGGPFPYEKDGSRFGNYERILPQQPRGYYREYTVKNSKSRNRGAKRIVCGGDQRAANDCYYTEDHYNSFKRITK
jgi:ribonuclease T1